MIDVLAFVGSALAIVNDVLIVFIVYCIGDTIHLSVTDFRSDAIGLLVCHVFNDWGRLSHDSFPSAVNDGKDCGVHETVV